MTRYMPSIVAVLLLCLMAVALYFQLLPFFSKEEETVVVSTGEMKSATQNKTSHDLSKFDLFGDATSPKAAPKPKPKNIPKTKLKLTLRGVMASDKEGSASALIEGPDRQTLNYRIDDELPGNAVLAAVHADRVTLSRNGSDENLFFPEQSELTIQRVSDRVDTQSSSDYQGSLEQTATPSPGQRALQQVQAKLPKSLIMPDKTTSKTVQREVSAHENEKREALKERLRVLRQRILDQ